MLNLTWFTSTATNADEECWGKDISIGEGEGNQVKFSTTRSPEQEPVAEFFSQQAQPLSCTWVPPTYEKWWIDQNYPVSILAFKVGRCHIKCIWESWTCHTAIEVNSTLSLYFTVVQSQLYLQRQTRQPWHHFFDVFEYTKRTFLRSADSVVRQHSTQYSTFKKVKAVRARYVIINSATFSLKKIGSVYIVTTIRLSA